MISLAGAEVHIWRASLSADESALGESWEILSEDEKARAERFYFERDKHRFVLARAGLRTLLGQYANRPAGAIPLQYGPSGKPCLPSSFGLEFNLSHSLDAALFAVARHPVGVDLEAIRPVEYALSVAEGFFAPSEIAALRLAPADQLSAAFLRCWTRKEAYVKACGDGLSRPLESFAVGLDGDPELGNWRLYNIDAGPGFLAALAVDCSNATLIDAPGGVGILTSGPLSIIFRNKGLDQI